MIHYQSDYFRNRARANNKLNPADVLIANDIFELIDAVADGGEFGVYISDKEYNYRVVSYLKARGFRCEERQDEVHSGIVIKWD